MNRLEAFGYVNLELEHLDAENKPMTAALWVQQAQELVDICRDAVENSKWINLKKASVKLSAHSFKLVEQFANQRDEV